MEESAGSSRLLLLDNFKGVVITIIVFVHVFLAVNGNGEPSVLTQCLYLGLFGFMILSGYFFRPGRGYVANIKKRCLQLAVGLTVCTVAVCVLSYVWCVAWGQAVDFDGFIDGLALGMALNKLFAPVDDSVIWSGCTNCIGYYFIWAMLAAFIIFYFVAERVIDSWKRSLVALAVFIVAACALRELYSYVLPFYVHLSLAAASFMMAGAMMAKFRLVEKIQDMGLYSWKYWALFLGTFAACFALVSVLPSGTRFNWEYYGEYGGYSFFSFFAEAVLINVFYFCLMALLVKIPLASRLFISIGQHTFGILLFHGFIVFLITSPFYTISPDYWLYPDFTAIQRLLIFVVTMAVCMVICIYGPAVLKRIKAALGIGAVRSAD